MLLVFDDVMLSMTRRTAGAISNQNGRNEPMNVSFGEVGVVARSRDRVELAKTRPSIP